jgi:hypothetical protein
MAVEELVPVLRGRPSGVFARTALIAGAYVEWGASPVALAIALSWHDVQHWLGLALTLMTRREFRDLVPAKAEIAEVASELGEHDERAECLADLAQVLDDEPLVVLDSATGRGFHLTMSGIGDNFQLHTLLADRLIGDVAQGLLAGVRPDVSWVAAATAGPTEPPNGLIRRSLRLFDASGQYVSPEGLPADIAVRDGVRVLVAYPPSGDYFWTSGRVFEVMTPDLRLDRTLTAQEALEWFARTAPAVQNDLFGPQG